VVEVLKPNELRLKSGHTHLAEVIDYWLSCCDITYAQFCKIADWGLGESGWIEKANLCRIRNGKNAKGCSLKNLLAFEAANQLIWKWQTCGETAAEQVYGPGKVWGVEGRWIRRCWWLPINGPDRLPLGFREFSLVLVGRLNIPYALTAKGKDATMAKDHFIPK
jgi:hypothetical protein